MNDKTKHSFKSIITGNMFVKLYHYLNKIPLARYIFKAILKPVLFKLKMGLMYT